jgi:hypothetical protein
MTSELESAGVADPESRRRFLKKAAVVSGAAWAAPVLTAMPAAGAAAGSPRPCNCHASAYGIRIKIPILGIDQIVSPSPAVPPGGQNCLVTAFAFASGRFNVTFPPLRPALTVSADVVCASADASCQGAAHVNNLDINFLSNNTNLVPSIHIHGTNNTLSTSAAVHCPDCHRENHFQLEHLTADIKVGTLPTIHVNLIDHIPCNFNPLALVTPPLPHILTLNERTCSSNRETVNALHLDVLGIVEVIVSHSVADSNVCDCNPACA